MSADDRLDHGLLNVPLHKRGDIDAQIDAYKREERRERRERDRQTFKTVREQTARVREMLAQLSDYRVQKLARSLGSRTANGARRALLQAAKSKLSAWLPALERLVNQEAAQRCELCACWQMRGDDVGACWSSCRSDDFRSGPSDITSPYETCECFVAGNFRAEFVVENGGNPAAEYSADRFLLPEQAREVRSS